MITDREFGELLSDPTKESVGDIRWGAVAGREPAQRFTIAVQSASGWPLRVEAWWNPRAEKLSYALIYEGVGRIVGLDVDPTTPHHNPGCRPTRSTRSHCDCPRGTHIQRWSEADGMARADATPEITASWDEPVAAWRQFCDLINLAHRGILREPER